MRTWQVNEPFLDLIASLSLPPPLSLFDSLSLSLTSSLSRPLSLSMTHTHTLSPCLTHTLLWQVNEPFLDLIASLVAGSSEGDAAVWTPDGLCSQSVRQSYSKTVSQQDLQALSQQGRQSVGKTARL